MPKKWDEKDKTQRKYVYYSIVYNFHAQSNIKIDFLRALSVLSCKHKKQIGNWLTLMLNNASQFLHEYCQRHFSFNVMFRNLLCSNQIQIDKKVMTFFCFWVEKLDMVNEAFQIAYFFEMRTRMPVVFTQ